MSRAYRISISESLRRHIQVDDGICSQLELLPILEPGRMGALLAAELEQKGFKVEDGKARRKESQGIELEIDVQTGEVKVTAEGHQELELSTTRTGTSERATDADREASLRKAAVVQLEREAAAKEESLRREVTEKLEGRLRDLRDELDSVVNRVTATALKQRAAELGTVEEIHEDPGTGSLTIKVRV